MLHRFLFDSGEYYPSPGEYQAVGIAGVFLFTLIFVSAVYSFAFLSNNSVENKRFYAAFALMAILELPRYFDIAIRKTYDCLGCYSSHIVADFLYFVGLAIVTFTLAHIYEIGPFVHILYSKSGILASVSAQAIVNSIAFIYCLTCSSLAVFFHSTMFTAFTVFDVLQCILYPALLSFYGIRLIIRFSNLKTYSSTSTQRAAFELVLRKITAILILVTIFSLMRLAVLIAKLTSLDDNGIVVTSPTFTLYGFAWFMLSDFLPRGANSLGLIFVMQSRRTMKPSSDNDKPSEGNGDIESAVRPKDSEEGHQSDKQPSSSVDDFDDFTDAVEGDVDSSPRVRDKFNFNESEHGTDEEGCREIEKNPMHLREL